MNRRTREKKNGLIRAIWLNSDGVTWGTYPEEKKPAEPAFNGFVPIEKHSELATIAKANKQECYLQTDENEVSYTICIDEKRAFSLSR
jgi:hypothetical protein